MRLSNGVRRLISRPSARFRERVVAAKVTRIDWRAWILLAWIAWFGSQYAAMMVREKLPRVHAWVAR